MLSLQLPDLTPDAGNWRLDWLGEVSYPPRQLRYAQPSVRIHLSPLTSELGDHEALNSTDTTDLSRQSSAWLPVGSLPLLRIGSVWQAGHMVLNPKYQHGTFLNLEINPATTSFIKAGLPLDDAYLLPLAEHPWHRRATQSYCICVDLPEGKRLLIPCLELIRFYFGSSSNLLGRLFKGPLQESRLWKDKRFDPASRHLHLELAPYLSGASASDIGRIALNKTAWHSAAGIYGSCVKATSQQHVVYPYTHFPFMGRTTLMATGRWVSFAGKRDMTFIVYQLLSCSHPFPFASLSYEVGKPLSIWRDQDPGTPPSSNPMTQTVRAVSSARQMTLSPHGDPGCSKTPRTLPTFDKTKFPDLCKKPVWLEKLGLAAGTAVFMRHANGRLEQVAFGDDADGSHNRGIDVAEQPHPEEVSLDEAKLPSFVQMGIRLLRRELADKHEVLKIVLLRLAGQVEVVFSLSALVDEDGVIDPVGFWTAPDGRHRQRRACVLKIEGASRPYVIVEGAGIRSKALVQVIEKVTMEGILEALCEFVSDLHA